MEPATFNGKDYTNSRELLVAVFEHIPPQQLGSLYVADLLRLVKLHRRKDPIQERGVSITPTANGEMPSGQ